MNLPGFTAEASLYAGAPYSLSMAVRAPNSELVRLQYTLPPWTPCSWLLFCCNEFGDQSCCRSWHLACVPE